VCHFSPKWAKTHLRSSVVQKKIFRLAVARRNARGREGDKTRWEWDRRGERRGQDGERRKEGTPPDSATDLHPWF
jgi:hypothetical protein